MGSEDIPLPPLIPQDPNLQNLMSRFSVDAEDMEAANQLHRHVHPLPPSQQSLSTTATLHSPSFSTIHIGDIVYFGNPQHSYVFLGVTAIHSDTDGSVAYEAAYSIPNSSGTPIIWEDVQIDNQPQNLKKYQMYFKRQVIILTLGVGSYLRTNTITIFPRSSTRRKIQEKPLSLSKNTY